MKSERDNDSHSMSDAHLFGSIALIDLHWAEKIKCRIPKIETVFAVTTM